MAGQRHRQRVVGEISELVPLVALNCVVIMLSWPAAFRAEDGPLVDDELVNAAQTRALDRIAILKSLRGRCIDQRGRAVEAHLLSALRCRIASGEDYVLIGLPTPPDGGCKVNPAKVEAGVGCTVGAR